MMVTGLVFIRKRMQKGHLKTNKTFAKKLFCSLLILDIFIVYLAYVF